MADDRNAPALKECHLFSDVPDAMLLEIESRMVLKQTEQSQEIVQRLDVDNSVYYILGGTFRATSFSENGRETIFRKLNKNEYFGEFAAIDGGPRTATVTSLTPGRLLHQSRSDFLNMMEQHPSISVKLLKQVTKRARYLANRVYELSTQCVEKRLHAELLRMAGFQEGKFTSTIDPFPRHVDIAGVIGTQREAVTRILSALTEKGVIRRAGRKVTIVNYQHILENANLELQ